MKVIKIKSKKQDNGIWGSPINLVKIDGVPPFLKCGEKDLLFSAIIIAVVEQFPDESFSVLHFGEVPGQTELVPGFIINFFDRSVSIQSIQPNRTQQYLIYYDMYFVEDDLLYQFENEKERKTFIRKKKIEKMKNE